MNTGKRKKKLPKERLKPFYQRLKDFKTPLSTSLGAINLILLGGAGEVPEEQRRFLGVAKKNLENLFCEIQKFLDSCDAKK
jgi:hypothetical protein